MNLITEVSITRITTRNRVPTFYVSFVKRTCVYGFEENCKKSVTIKTEYGLCLIDHCCKIWYIIIRAVTTNQ